MEHLVWLVMCTTDAAGNMVDRELEALKREFLAEAQAKVVEIVAAVDNGRDSESLDRLAYLAHQLKGSGGSYGYANISDDAAEIEKAVEQIAQGDDRDGAENVLRARSASLRNAIEGATRELGG
jgi:HPt (histidine-containing phosphotransfer) domain-containing protein